MARPIEMSVKPGAEGIAHKLHIYIYRNTLTNQVVYSLRQSMKNNQSLKQLAYFGKKTIPAKLRKDVWTPLLSVSFPHQSQCMDAFHKLREYRRLRDVNWDRDSEKIPLEKKRRKKALMDQKAEAVADLAAILQRQEDFGRETQAKSDAKQEEYDAWAERELTKAKAEIEGMARRFETGEGSSIEQKIEDLTAHMLGERYPTHPAPGEKRKKQLALQILELRQLKGRLRRAHETTANKQISEKAQHQVDKLAISRALRGEIPREVITQQQFETGPRPLPKFGRRRLLLRPKSTSFHTTEGVEIRWANVMDAEYAESWPQKIKHYLMGFARNAAPKPEEAPILEHPAWRLSPIRFNEELAARRAAEEHRREVWEAAKEGKEKAKAKKELELAQSQREKLEMDVPWSVELAEVPLVGTAKNV
ncbi:MAG: hypothetical protein M1820_001968 [Bogoriella megaspora]|nr:MAG: hypothetical protein M1820_001968 [Bogoriella megaspora]